MLRISEEQHLALQDAARKSYLAALQDRVVERSPELAGTLDKAGLREVVEHAVASAEGYGFTHRGPVRFYLDACLMFGSGYVRDPMYPWAREAVDEPDPETQTERAEGLYERATECIDAICGPDDVHSLSALRAVSAWARDDHTLPRDGLEDYAVAQMQRLYPQKAVHAGENALRSLYQDAQSFCSNLGVDEPRAIVLCTTLKYAFGAGCFDDPLYGWIRDTMERQRVQAPSARFEHLERRAVTWLDAVLAHQA